MIVWVSNLGWAQLSSSCPIHMITHVQSAAESSSRSQSLEARAEIAGLCITDSYPPESLPGLLLMAEGQGSRGTQNRNTQNLLSSRFGTGELCHIMAKQVTRPVQIQTGEINPIF